MQTKENVMNSYIVMMEYILLTLSALCDDVGTSCEQIGERCWTMDGNPPAPDCIGELQACVEECTEFPGYNHESIYTEDDNSSGYCAQQ